MKELINKSAAQLHVFIILYGLWTMYGLYEEHAVRLQAIEDEFPTIQANITNTQKRVHEITEFKKRREESELRVQEVERNIIEVQRRLPENIVDNDILSFFNQEFTSLGIKEPAVIPGTEVPSTFYISKQFSFKAKGTYLQFLIFFERIGNASRIYNVKSLHMTVSNDGQRGRFQIVSAESVIEAFRFNPDFKVTGLEEEKTP